MTEKLFVTYVLGLKKAGPGTCKFPLLICAFLKFLCRGLGTYFSLCDHYQSKREPFASQELGNGSVNLKSVQQACDHNSSTMLSLLPMVLWFVSGNALIIQAVFSRLADMAGWGMTD